MTQTIDLTKYVDPTLIDTGLISFNFSAWIGGSTTQEDNARLSLDFYDAASGYVGTPTVLGPVSMADRSGITSLLPRSATDLVPIGARTMTVLVIITRDTPVLNNGDVDNIRLSLYK